jgi:hypothetical protein
MMKKTFEMIDLIKKNYNIDNDRLYIHGTSMGAIGTYAVIQKFSGMFAGGYAVCGWASPSIAPQLARVPFWAFHGDEDPIVSVDGSRGIYQAVLAHGGKQIRYTEFKGVKHDAWNYVNDNETYKWLLAQRKGDESVHRIPDKVSNIRAKVLKDQNIFIEWENISKADKDLWYYKIYRNNTLIGEADSNSLNFTDSSTAKNTTYDYKVSAVNYYFKESEPSSGVRLNSGD